MAKLDINELLSAMNTTNSDAFALALYSITIPFTPQNVYFTVISILNQLKHNSDNVQYILLEVKAATIDKKPIETFIAIDNNITWLPTDVNFTELNNKIAVMYEHEAVHAQLEIQLIVRRNTPIPDLDLTIRNSA